MKRIVSLIAVLAMVIFSVTFLNACSLDLNTTKDKDPTEQSGNPTPQPANDEAHEFEIRVFELTNAERTKAGLAPYVWHDILWNAAQPTAKI